MRTSRQDNVNRGIGIFSNHDIFLEIAPYHNKKFRYIIPVNVTGRYKINLYAVWAMNETKDKRHQRYIGQVVSALKYYQISSQEECIILGDFNWNLNFDKNSYGLCGKFSNLLDKMDKLNFRSVYHHYYNEMFGNESNATLYLRGQESNPFHIDYMFTSKKIIDKVKMVNVGKRNEWCIFSDHMPLYLNC